MISVFYYLRNFCNTYDSKNFRRNIVKEGVRMDKQISSEFHALFLKWGLEILKVCKLSRDNRNSNSNIPVCNLALIAMTNDLDQGFMYVSMFKWYNVYRVVSYISNTKLKFITFSRFSP